MTRMPDPVRMRTSLLACCALALSVRGTFAETSPGTAEDRFARLEKRLEYLEKKYQADMKTRDEEIARLRALIAGERPATTQDKIEKEKQDILKDIESRLSSPLTARTPASFNPDLAVIGDFRGNVSTDKANPARNRLDLDSVELDLRAAVDPRADAVVVLPISRDMADPLFFDPAQADGSVDTSVDIEEAYLFLHDFGIPNLTAKLGRFHLRFGRWNQFHSHNWPTVDNAFAVESFLGPEALTDSGVSLSYIIPPKLIGNQYVELVAELVSGEGASDDPVLNNDASIHSPALNTHLLWNHDLTKDWNVEAGGSWLMGHHDNDNSLEANLFGADLTLIHTDPTGRFNNQLFQAELFHGNVDTWSIDTPTGDEGLKVTQEASGAYLLAQQQLNRDWYLGCRLDWTQNAVDDQQQVWGVSPYVSWYLSEFLRVRLEYQHKAGDTPTEDTLFFQVNWVFGAHPPHPYWAMR